MSQKVTDITKVRELKNKKARQEAERLKGLDKYEFVGARQEDGITKNFFGLPPEKILDILECLDGAVSTHELKQYSVIRHPKMFLSWIIKIAWKEKNSDMGIYTGSPVPHEFAMGGDKRAWKIYLEELEAEFVKAIDKNTQQQKAGWNDPSVTE